MDRTELLEKFVKADEHLDDKRMWTIVFNNAEKTLRKDGNFKNIYLIIMEELSELSQKVSKQGRGMCEDYIGLVEEMADVSICLVMLQKICNVSTKDVIKTINVKLDRIEEKISNEGYYK